MLFVVCCLLFVVCCLLFVVCCLLFVVVVVVVVVVVPSDPSSARIFSDVLPNVNEGFMSMSLTVRAVWCMWGWGGVGWV